MILLLAAVLHLVLLFTPVTAVSGWMMAFLPGSLALYGPFAENAGRMSRAGRFGLAVILSLAVAAASPLLAARFTGGQVTREVAVQAYAAVVGAEALLYAVLRWRRGGEFSRRILRAELRSARLPAWAVAAFLGGLAVMLVHMLLYRYLPEADGYGWGVILRQVQASGGLPNGVTRTQFIGLAQTMLGVTGSSIFWYFKAVLPLLVWLAAWAAGAGWVAPSRLPAWLKAAFAALYLAVPVLAMELLVGRPQSFALIYYLLLPLILRDAARAKAVDLFILATACVLAAFRIHELMVLLLPVIGLCALATWWTAVRRSPRRSALYLGAFGALLLAAAWPTSAGEYVRVTAGIMADGMRQNGFRLWFLSHYVNTDNIELGWPGWQAALYYGYNLGFILPFLGSAGLAARWRAARRVAVWPLGAAACACAFLAFAEILPRLGSYLLPDRAWIFLSLSLVAIAQANAQPIGDLVRASRLWKILFLLAVAGSLLAGAYVTHAKQGRVSANEYAAAAFVRGRLPADAAVVSQGLNQPIVEFFGERQLIRLPAYFEAGSAAGRQDALASLLVPQPGQPAGVADLQDRARQALAEPILSVSAGQEARSAVDAALDAIASRLAARPAVPASRDIYVLYSTDKLLGLSATRAWWRAEAFPGFPAAAVNGDPYASLVYSNPSVQVWKVDTAALEGR